MPRNCRGEQCHKELCPPIFIYNGKDAVADSQPNEGYGVDLCVERDGTMYAEILDMFAEEAVVKQPIVQAVRGAKPEPCSEQQQRCCRQQRQEDSRHGKGKRDAAKYYQNNFHATKVVISKFFPNFVAIKKTSYDMSNKIGIACDHAGYDMKELLTGYLAAKGFEIFDFGCNSDESCDYADYAHPLAEALESGEFDRAIGICGSGEGMAITLNKHQKIRASICWIPEIAAITRQHNDSNVLVLPARFIDNDTAIEILEQWLNTPFESGGRHERRIAKIAVK